MKPWNPLALCTVLAAGPALAATTGSPAGTVAPPSASSGNRPVSGPVYLSTPPRPLLPPIAVAAKIRGVTIVCVTVEPDGSVADARVRSLPSVRSGSDVEDGKIRAQLTQAALAYVEQWRFRPRLIHGKPAATPNVCRVLRYNERPGS